LVALEWLFLVVVVELDDDVVFLYVRDTEPIVRQRGDEHSPLRKVVAFVKERAPTDTERRLRMLFVLY
jgi:hypothetical protein